MGKRFALASSVILVSSSLVLPPLCPAAGDQASPKERFMREYPAALKRLGNSYLHFRGVGTETVARQSKSKDWTTSAASFNFNVDGDNIKISREYNDGRYIVQSASAKYAFRAEARKQGDPLVLNRLQERENSRLASSIEQFRRDYLFAPFSIREPISDFLWDPKVTTIERVALVARDGRDLIRVDYTRIIKFEGKPTKMKCWLLVAPDEGWALVEQGRMDERGFHKSHTKIEYGSPVDGIPTPKRVTMDGPFLEFKCEFDQYVFARTNDDEFGLSSVGLPETVPPPPPGKTRAKFFWLFNLTCAGILLVIVVVRRRVALRTSRIASIS